MTSKEFYIREKDQGNTNLFVIMDRYAAEKKQCNCNGEARCIITQQEATIKALRKDILRLRQEIRDLSGWDDLNEINKKQRG